MLARSWPIVLSIALAMLGVSCSTTEVEPPATDATAAASLPRLAPGFTVGTTLYGGADVTSLGAAERALLDTAAARGLGGFTYYVDWGDLEPEAGRYTLSAFTAQLDALRRLGVQPFVNLTIGDIEDYNLPAGLSDGQGGLADGVSLDDPAVIERFGRLLDQVVPVLLAHEVFLLGVGNEVDARFDGPYPDERDAYVRFVDAARERVRAIDSRLAVGVTLTMTAVREQSPTFQALRGVTDIIPLNYAPIQPDFFVRDVDAIQPDFQSVLSAYGDGPIVIQELTCPSAASMGASEAWQRACFEQLFEVIGATPSIRFASVFTFQDFDDATCKAVQDALFGNELDDLPDAVAQRLADYLCQLGVVAPDGTPKPAWNAVLDAAASD